MDSSHDEANSSVELHFQYIDCIPMQRLYPHASRPCTRGQCVFANTMELCWMLQVHGRSVIHSKSADSIEVTLSKCEHSKEAQPLIRL